MRGWTRPNLPGLSHRTPSFWAWLAVWLLSGAALLFHAWLWHHQGAGSAERALASGQRVLIDPATGKITGRLAPTPAEPAPEPKPPEPAKAPAEEPTSPAVQEPAPEPQTPPAEEAPTASPAPETPAPETPKPEPVAPSDAAAPAPSVLPPVRADLHEKGKEGSLPIVGKDGASAASAYARPTPAAPEGKPRIALLVMQVGLNPAMAQAVMALPQDISLSVSPYAPKPGEWVALARNRGHEALLDLPMEPRDFPISDAGPYALSPREDAPENEKRLHWVLERAEGYVGLAATPREHYLSLAGPAAPLLKEMKDRGLLLVASSPRAALTLAQMPAGRKGATLSATSVIDDMLSPEAIDAQLGALEATARKDGQALAILRPYPLSLARTKAWLDGLEARGFQLVPVTALLPRPEAQGALKPEPKAADHHE